MRKFFSISRNQVTVIITLTVLVTLAAWYYLQYIPRNEKELYKQHFRWLQTIDINIRSKIDASEILLGNLLKEYNSYNKKIDLDYKQHYKEFISRYTKDIFVISETDMPNSSKELLNISRSPGIHFSLFADSAVRDLIITAVNVKAGDSLFNTLSLHYNFEQFIKPLLPSHIFEHYVVFYDGKYVYEDFRSGLGYNVQQEDSLLKVGKGITGATIIDQTVGGVNYKMFLQPINFFGGKRLIVAGMHSQEKLDTEKKQLPPGVLLPAIIIAVAILLFLPWFKVHLLGKYDRIGLNDAAGSVLVAKLLMSLLVLFFFEYNFSFRPGTRSHSKRVLADAVKSALKKDINSAYASLNKFDMLIYNKKMFYDVINLGKGDVKKNTDTTGNVFNLQKYQVIDQLKDTPRFAEINWLDNTGKVKYNWTRSNYNNVHANYKDREYFISIIQNNTITPNRNQDASFVLDQVISRTEGSFRTIICKKSILDTLNDKDKSAKVVTMSFMMKSLDSVIMPAGYSFAIIDDKGDVKYHSNQDRNLNENLTEEFSNKKELHDVLQGRFTKVFKTKYYEDNYSVRAEPIKDYSYFIVIMSDQSFPESVNIEIFSFTWGMILLFLVVAIIDLFILITASSRWSMFGKQFLITSWLWPRESSRDEYLVAGLGNIIMIIFLIIGFNLFHYLAYFFVLLFCVPLLTIFLNTLFLQKYRIEKNKAYCRYKVRCARWSAGFLLLLNLFSISELEFLSFVQILFFELLIMGAGWLLLYYYNHAGRKNKKVSSVSKPDYLNCYMFMVLTRLLVTSGIPVIFFYTSSYNFEQNLLARYRQYDYVMQLQNKFHGLRNVDSTIITNYRKAIFTDSTWINKVEVTSDTACVLSGASLSKEEYNTAKIFNLFGTYLEDISGSNNNNFFQSSSSDGYYRFNNIFKDVLYGPEGSKLCIQGNMPVSTKQGNDTAAKYLVISSGRLNYLFPRIFSSIKGTMFWLLLLIAIVLFYFILLKVVKRVCSLNFQYLPSWKNFHTVTTQMQSPGSLLWVVGLPASDMLHKVVEDLRKTEGDIFTAKQDYVLDFENIELPAGNKATSIDLRRMNDDNYILRVEPASEKHSHWDAIKATALASSCPYIILLNMENKLDDLQITAAKLKCTKELLKDKKVIIISAMHPLNIQDILIRENKSAKELPNTPTEKLMHTVFSSSFVIILPLVENKFDEEKKELPENVEDPAESDKMAIIRKVMDKETKYTGFFKEFRQPFIEACIESETSTKKLQTDMLILKIQSFAHNFYVSIWQSLSLGEKFILHDLAEDGLVNIKNSFAVNLLINKGLLTMEDGSLHIFNTSFRNFIVTSIGDHETAHIQKLHSTGSKWNKLQLPFLLLILAVFIFLAISQNELYPKVIAILTGVVTGIPTLLKLLSMLGVQNSRESKSEQPKGDTE